MSKEKEAYPKGEAEFTGQLPENMGQDGTPPPDGNGQANIAVQQANAAVEGLAKRLGVSAPVFAAVMQMQGWASGKTVSETDFKKAVEAFLGAPISGVKENKGGEK
jgi:hypothetical protein